MGVTSFQEIIGRSFQHRFGESPSCERKFSVTLDAPDTSHQEILDAIAIKHGSGHPEWSYLLCHEGSISEGNPTPFHAEVSYRYEVPKVSSTDYQPNPLQRADIWSFSTGGAAVPALTYYSGSGNGTQRVLTNSAGDFFEGAMTEEGELRATIAGNRATFPLEVAVAVTNCVNASTYLGGPAHSWKCQGISAQQQVEVVDGAQIKYWSVSVELAYRQSGWDLLLPNVGWNYVEGGKKKRAYVTDENDEKVAASNPQPLDANGGLVTASPGESNPPMILTRRVHKVVDFASYFGTPTF
jgi:hypothetical protein